MNVNLVRKVTITGEGQQSLDSLAGSLNKVAAAQNGVASVTDIQTKRQLSSMEAYRRQTLAVVEGARAQDQYARAVKIADSALRQGGISTSEHAQRIGLLQQKYGQAAESANVFSGAIGKVTAALGPMFALLSVGTMVAFAKSVFATAASLDEMAEQAGVSTEALQAYRAAMLQSGIAAEQTDQILTRLTRSISTALDGPGKQRDAFVQLGISVATLREGTEATMPVVMRALGDMGSAGERARLEVDLFSKSGQKLESAIGALQDPTATLIEKQRVLGQVLGTDVTKAADEAADRFTAAFNRMKNEATPAITGIMAKVADLLGAMDRANNWLKEHLPAGAAFNPGGSSASGGTPVASQSRNVVGSQPATSPGAAFSSPSLDGVMVKLREEAALTGKTADERARIVALREAEAAKMKDGNGHLTEAEKLEVSRLAVVSSRYDMAKKAADEQAKADKQAQDDLEKFNETVFRLGSEYEAESKKRIDAAAKIKQDQADYIQDLRDEAHLAGLSREEAEKQAAVLRGVRQYQIEIGSAQARQIEKAVELRQVTERYRGLVDDIAGSFQSFFEDVLDKGKLSFQSLWDSVKQQFVRMLAYMASQALIQPIIVPVVQSFADMFGMQLPTGSAAVGTPFQGLSMATNAGSIFGGGSGLGSIFGSSALSTGGSLLSKLVPGAMIAYAASQLGTMVFGKKNDTALGGALLGLPGAFLGSLTGTSNNGAISNFTDGGLGNTLFKAGGGNNSQAPPALPSGSMRP
jgi:hypothetical protein